MKRTLVTAAAVLISATATMAGDWNVACNITNTSVVTNVIPEGAMFQLDRVTEKVSGQFRFIKQTADG